MNYTSQMLSGKRVSDLKQIVKDKNWNIKLNIRKAEIIEKIIAISLLETQERGIDKLKSL